MTRSELERILSRGRLFCDFWVVGYFLGLSWNGVDHLYETGRLPKVFCRDGSRYRPSGERLVHAEKFAEILPDEHAFEFALWRSAAFDVEPFGSRQTLPPALGTLMTSAHPVAASVNLTDV